MDETTLSEMLANRNWRARVAAAANPNATEEVLMAALKDEHPWVREAHPPA